MTVRSRASGPGGRRRRLDAAIATWLAIGGLLASVPGWAAAAELGRLFYTPAQRAELEAARSHLPPPSSRRDAPSAAPAGTLRFDGIVIRSDGKTTRWIDGKPQAGAAGVAGLKPGQIRADGKVYEPYQVMPAASPVRKPVDIKEESAP